MGFRLSKSEHEAIIKSKVASFSMTSPIDTIRQNLLLGKKITLKKVSSSMVSSAVVSAMISIPCHYSMILSDLLTWSPSLIFGVLVANVVKVPTVYYHKRIQTGLSLLKLPAKKNISNVFKVSIVEDMLEEGAKTYFSKVNMKSNSNKHNPIVLSQAAALFLIAYPFDLLKNKNYYSCAIKVTKSDFAIKALYKNLQNIMFLSLLPKKSNADINE